MKKKIYLIALLAVVLLSGLLVGCAKEHRVTIEYGLGIADTVYVIPDGGTVTEPAKPTAEGYEFDGWYLAGDVGEAYDFSTPVTGDFTIQAGWVQATPDIEDLWESLAGYWFEYRDEKYNNSFVTFTAENGELLLVDGYYPGSWGTTSKVTDYIAVTGERFELTLHCDGVAENEESGEIPPFDTELTIITAAIADKQMTIFYKTDDGDVSVEFRLVGQTLSDADKYLLD